MLSKLIAAAKLFLQDKFPEERFNEILEQISGIQFRGVALKDIDVAALTDVDIDEVLKLVESRIGVSSDDSEDGV